MNIQKMAKKLVELRGDCSQEIIAKKAGISISALSMYEQGNRVPRDEIKVKLARIYDTTVEELFFAN